MRVFKWKNSLTVRLPAALVSVLNLKEGDNVELHAVRTQSLDTPKASKNKELLSRIRKFRGQLPADFKFDRAEDNCRKSLVDPQ